MSLWSKNLQITLYGSAFSCPEMTFMQTGSYCFLTLCVPIVSISLTCSQLNDLISFFFDDYCMSTEHLLSMLQWGQRMRCLAREPNNHQMCSELQLMFIFWSQQVFGWFRGPFPWECADVTIWGYCLASQSGTAASLRAICHQHDVSRGTDI